MNKLKLVVMSVLMIMVMAVMPITTAYASTGNAEQESAWSKLADECDVTNSYGRYYGNSRINGYPAYLLSELNPSGNTITSLEEKKSICERLVKDGYVCVYGANKTITEDEYIAFFDIYVHCRDNKIVNLTDIEGNRTTTNSCELWFDKATYDMLIANYTALEEEAQIIANGSIPTKLKRDDLAKLIGRNIVFDELALSGGSNNSDGSNANSSNENASASNPVKDVVEDVEKDVADNSFPTGIVVGVGVGLLAIIVILAVLLMRKKKNNNN